MKKTTAEKIQSELEKKKQIETQIKQLQQQEREEKETAKKNRLYKWGCIVEKQIPDLATFTDEQFNMFADKVLFTEQTKRIISEISNPAPATSRSAKSPKTESDFETEPLTTQGDES